MYQVGYYLSRTANSYPERTAIIHQGVSLTYADFNSKVNRLADSLQQLGVQRGQRIAYIYKNSIAWCTIFYAAQKLGAAAVPLNTNLLADDICQMVKNSKAKILLYQADFAPLIQTIKGECPDVEQVVCGGDTVPVGELRYQDLIENGRDIEPTIDVLPDDESIIIFTSGTTGISKGVIRTQRMMKDYSMMMAIENENCNQPEILMTHSPLFHTGGLFSIIKMVLMAGTLVLIDKVEPYRILEQIEEYKVTQLFMLPPIIFMRLGKCLEEHNFDLSSVREAQTGGGKCTLEYAAKIYEMFPNCKIRLSYGSSETCGPTSIFLHEADLAEHPEWINSIGRLNSMVEMRLVDEQGQDVPRGEVGEAIVRSSMLFNEYLNLPELSKQVFTDGWFHTEDLMYLDDDDCYYLVDRKRDIVKTGGENVYAQEIEGVLGEHPAILECAVIGVPDKRFGEAVAIAIVLNPGMKLTAEELIAYSKAHLAGYKKPRYWAIMDALPTNTIGKLQKSVLREHAAEWFTQIID